MLDPHRKQLVDWSDFFVVLFLISALSPKQQEFMDCKVLVQISKGDAGKGIEIRSSK